MSASEPQPYERLLEEIQAVRDSHGGDVADVTVADYLITDLGYESDDVYAALATDESHPLKQHARQRAHRRAA